MLKVNEIITFLSRVFVIHMLDHRRAAEVTS